MLRVCRAVWQPHMRARPSCVARRHLSTPVVSLPEDFAFFPDFFTVDEQSVLLKAALRKLDGMESGKVRRRRREYLRGPAAAARATSLSPVQSLFLPDEFYDFQEARPTIASTIGSRVSCRLITYSTTPGSL